MLFEISAKEALLQAAIDGETAKLKSLLDAHPELLNAGRNKVRLRPAAAPPARRLVPPPLRLT